MGITLHYLRWICISFLLLIIIDVQAADPLGKTLLARGTVTADRGNSTAALRRLSPVFRQDILRSGNNARAQFRMIDDAYINLQQNSVLRLEKYELNQSTQEGNVLMELISGGLRTITGKVGKKNKQDYQLNTPVATIGIRGTMYEVEIVSEGMYVAAWQGNIWIRSFSGRCDLILGDGQPFNFALVNSEGECQTLSIIPEIFREGHSSDSNERPELAEVEIAPLFDNPRREQFDYSALFLGLGNIALTSGQANQLNIENAILLSETGFLSSGGAIVTDFFQDVGGYSVSWGRWDNYSILDGLEGNSSSATDDDGLIWTTYGATEPEDVMSRQGMVRYDNMVDSFAQSSLGEVSNVAVQMDVDFDAGAVSNGAMSANVPGYFWAAIFDGQVQNGDLSLQFNGGSLVDSETGAFTDVSGQIGGDFVGGSSEAIVGGFSLVDEANNANQIEGVFLVEQ